MTDRQDARRRDTRGQATRRQDARGQDAPRHHATAEAHASTGTYLKVAAILTIVTALEFSSIYIRALTPILIPLLIVLSAGKFALVVLFFMHLRYDSRVLTTLFTGPLILAIGIGLALSTLTGAFLIYGR